MGWTLTGWALPLSAVLIGIGVWMCMRDRGSFGALVVVVSVLPLILDYSPLKAAFVWLGILGLLGGAAVMLNGLIQETPSKGG